MAKVKVTLLKPLNGAAIGSPAEYGEQDAKRLEALGAVARVKVKKTSPPKNKQAAPPENKADKQTAAPVSPPAPPPSPPAAPPPAAPPSAPDITQG